jgi:quaternary ammonium compound-resistance protein SugE
MFAWLAVLAALLFSAGGYFTKLSAGLTARGPTAAMFMLFALGAGVQALAMRHESMAVTYVIVLGLEAVMAYVLSTFVLHEPGSAMRLAGIGLVVAGIALLRMGPS